MARDVHLLLAELDTGPVTAIGSSMGGAIAKGLAAAHPGDVSAMVLSNTWAATDNFTGLLFDHWTALANAGNAAGWPSRPSCSRSAPSSWTPRAWRSRR